MYCENTRKSFVTVFAFVKSLLDIGRGGKAQGGLPAVQFVDTVYCGGTTVNDGEGGDSSEAR